MTSWRVIAIRHSLEFETLYVVDHWRVWARTRDANGELRDIPGAFDAPVGRGLGEAVELAAEVLAQDIFPHTGLEVD